MSIGIRRFVTAIKGKCQHCGYTVILCVACQAIMPEGTHAARKYCDTCRRVANAEIWRKAQSERRGALKDLTARVEDVEAQIGLGYGQ